jgi:hypothetical protein
VEVTRWEFACSKPLEIPLVLRIPTIRSATYDSFRLTTDDQSSNGVPGPLPLFGAGAAFGFSRKMRKRINDSKLPVASAMS